MYTVYPPRSWRGYVATKNIPTLKEAVEISVRDYETCGHIKFTKDK